MSEVFTTTVSVDSAWILFCGFLVFFMNTGFGCLEAGFCRSKNTVNILAKNFVVFALASLAYWVVGFGIMYGAGNNFFGQTGWLLQGADNSPLTAEAYSGVFPALNWVAAPLFVKFFFQLVFAGTAATIVSGCVAERVHYIAFMIFSLILVAVIYPCVGHWIWGGGWLQNLGMRDFAGCAVVHSVGGWAGLAGILLLGPRLGKYKGRKTNAIPGHSMALVFIGTMILWLGWFGFNPGSTMAISGGNVLTVGHIILTTNLSCSAGVLAATLLAWRLFKKPDFSMTVNGALAGLVGITAGCAYVTPLAAVIIGALSGVLVVYGARFFDDLRIDDPVGALAVHLLCGTWGLIAVGLFATTSAPGAIPMNGLFYGGGFNLLLIQVIGIAAVGAFTFISSILCWGVLRKLIGLRVSPVVEVEGLDVHEMGSEAYPTERIIDLERLLEKVARLERSNGSLPDEALPEKRAPRSAKIPAGSPPYILSLHNVDMQAFLERWRKLCGSEEPASSDFREIYQHFTTFSGRNLKFRGGNPQEVKEKLQALASTIDEQAFAEVRVGWNIMMNSEARI